MSSLPRGAAKSPVCGHWIGAVRRYCLAGDDLRSYLTGRRCPLHTPAALAGRPEPRPGPGLPAGAWTTPSPLAASALIDERAIGSGNRRSSQHTYRAAQAAQHPQRE
ncbi:hypothetical protein [Streptomyces prunicolor]|uniref:hypothetical protein n=1 Tax=Streptomyces prunicolor TaxID=67348 RepID=UPI00157BA760|nr:hypothetical protein [Streptomyces prunicolor]